MNDLVIAATRTPLPKPEWPILWFLFFVALMGVCQLFDRRNEHGVALPVIWAAGWLGSCLAINEPQMTYKVYAGLWIVLLIVVWTAKHWQGDLWKISSNRSSWYWLYGSATIGSFLGFASSDAGQASPMIAWFIDTFGFSQASAETATIAIRKAIHFTYFGLIAGLAWGGAIRLSGDVRRSAMFALLWTASFAAFDELNQLRFASRSGSVWDFLIDMAGAGAFIGIAVWRRNRRGQFEDADQNPLNP